MERAVEQGQVLVAFDAAELALHARAARRRTSVVSDRSCASA